MGTVACTLMILLVVLSAGCGARSPRAFVVIAEGLTSPSLFEGIRVAPRMFSAPQIVEACQDPKRIRRLEISSKSLELQVGERFPLTSLIIVAINDADVAVSGVPITIEAEDFSPPVLQLRSDDPDLNEGRLTSLNTGRFRIRIRTLCTAPPTAEVVVSGRVVD